MKKAFFILAVLFTVASWLPGCTMKGSQDYVSDFLYRSTPSPTVTVTITPTP